MPLTDQTDNFNIPKEAFKTGITDARTFNAAMDWLDGLFAEGAIFGDKHWRGPVANVASLPAILNTPGDVRVTLDTFQLWVWNGSAWQLPLTSDKFETYVFARDANSTNAYLRMVDGIPSNLSGYPMFKASTVRFITVNTRTASNCTIEIYRSGSAVPIDTLVLNGTYAHKVSTAAIPAGEGLQCRVLGGPARTPTVTVIVE